MRKPCITIINTATSNLLCETYRWEGLDLLLIQVIPTQIKLRIIHCQSTFGTVRSAQKRLHGNRLDAVVGPIGRVFEVQCSCPVVGEVVRHLARSTCSARTHIAGHSSVERIAANNVMDVSGWERAWLCSGVKALEGQGGTGEAESRLDGSDEREGCEGLHLGDEDGSRGEVEQKRCNTVSTWFL
jgi:hypothetical protein